MQAVVTIDTFDDGCRYLENDVVAGELADRAVAQGWAVEIAAETPVAPPADAKGKKSAAA